MREEGVSDLRGILGKEVEGMGRVSHPGTRVPVFPGIPAFLPREWFPGMIFYSRDSRESRRIFKFTIYDLQIVQFSSKSSLNPSRSIRTVESTSQVCQENLLVGLSVGRSVSMLLSLSE